MRIEKNGVSTEYDLSETSEYFVAGMELIYQSFINDFFNKQVHPAMSEIVKDASSENIKTIDEKTFAEIIVTTVIQELHIFKEWVEDLIENAIAEIAKEEKESKKELDIY